MKLISIPPLAASLAVLSSPALSQCPEQLLLASDGVDLSYYGSSISIDGNRAIIGAAGATAVSGKAYIQRLVGGQWLEEAILDPSTDDVSASAGAAVAIQGTVAAVGAPFNDTQGIGNSGAVYLFERQGGIWVEIAEIIEPVVQPNNLFGSALLFQGDQLLIGAPDAGSVNQGLVYILNRSGSGWASATFGGTLMASDGQTGDFFGQAMAIDDAQLVVGARLEDEAATNSGALYVFDRGGPTWTSSSSIAKLTLSNPLVRDELGSSVAISGTRILGGAPGDSQNDPGAAYHWDRVGSTWVDATEDGTMTPSVPGGMQLGASVALDGSWAYAGGTSVTGTVRRYEWNGSQWVGELQITPPGVANGDAFGTVMALRGSELWTGAPNYRENGARLGAVYRMTPRLEINYCVGAPNSDGGGARLSTCGSTSVSDNSLQLIVSASTNNLPGIFFYGSGTAQVPFGDGFLCISGAFHRLIPAINTDQGGGYHYDLNLNAPPANSGPGAIHAGSTWNFQFWYRDPTGPGGSVYNLSDAVAVSFTP